VCGVQMHTFNTPNKEGGQWGDDYTTHLQHPSKGGWVVGVIVCIPLRGFTYAHHHPLGGVEGAFGHTQMHTIIPRYTPLRLLRDSEGGGG